MSAALTFSQLADVLSAPQEQWPSRLSGGLQLAENLLLQVQAEPIADGVARLRRLPTSSPVGLAELASVLGEEVRSLLAQPELGPVAQIRLADFILDYDWQRSDLRALTLVLSYPLSWDFGAALLGRSGQLVLSDIRATVDPLSLVSDEPGSGIELTAAIALPGGASIAANLSLPDLSISAGLEANSRILLRDMVPLLGLDALPPGMENLAISKLSLEADPRQKSGGVMIDLSDVFNIQLADRSFAVKELFFGANYDESGISGYLGGALSLAGVPLRLCASSSPGEGWTFTSMLAGSDAGSAGSTLKLRPMLAELLGNAPLPPEVPDLEFTALSLAITPQTGELALACAATVDLSLGSSDVKVQNAALHIGRQAGGSISINLALECSANIADTLQIEKSTLNFTFDTASKAWSLSGGFKATLFNQQPALNLQASLQQSPSGTQISFTAEGAEVGFELVKQPAVWAYLGFRSFTLDRQQSGTKISAAVRARLVGLPAPLDRCLPQQLDLVGSFAAGTLSLALAATFGVDIALPAFEVAGKQVALGTMRLEVSSIGLQISRTPSFSATVGLGLPSELNKIFGTQASGAASIEVFRTFIPPQPGSPPGDSGLIRLALQLSTSGLSAQLLDPPLKCITGAGTQWSLNLGEFGAVSLTMPTISASGANLSGSGSISVDPQRGLHLPLTPIRALFEMAGLGEAAKALPRSVRLDRIHLLDASGEVDLPGMLGVRREDLPAEVRSAMAALGQITKRLPARLQSYLAFDISTLSFSISTDAAGNLSIEVATGRDTPLRCLLPGFPFITGVQLRRLSFGPVMGGSLFKLDIDADIDVFDFATLIMAEAMPDHWFGEGKDQPLPLRATIQRTLHLNNLMAIIVYQAGIPIPLPLLYTKLGYTYTGIEGFQSELHLFCHSPKAATTGKFSFDMGEALALLGSLKRFFTERSYLLSAQKAPEGLNLAYRIYNANLTLPRYLGGSKFGIDKPVEVVNLYTALAGTLDTIKTGSPGYLIKAAPLDQRVGKLEMKLLDSDIHVDWALLTREELGATSGKVAKLFVDGNLFTSSDVQALMPSPATLGGAQLTAAPDPNDLLCAMRGGFSLAQIIQLDSMFVMRASPVGGFATAMLLRGQLASMIGLELRGLLKVAPKGDQPLLMAGTSRLTFNQRTVMSGSFTIASNLFQIEGLIDLFPPESPIALRGRLAGSISKERFMLSGQGELALMHIPLVGAQLEMVLDRSEYALKVGTTLLGASASFLLRASSNKLTAEGSMSPISIGKLLTITKERNNKLEGPQLTLEHTLNPSATKLELNGYASLLGMADLQTKVSIGPDGTRFSLNSRGLGGIIQTDFDCLLPAAGGLRVAASFSLVASGPQTVTRTLTDGKTRQETSPALNHAVGGSLLLMALPPPTQDSQVSPWLKLETQQKVLLSPTGPLRSAGSAATKLAALEDSLWLVHELHVGLTATRSRERRPLASLQKYIEAMGSVRTAMDALAPELASLAQARPADAPIWHELASCLAGVRAAWQRGLSAATALQAREAQVQTQLDSLLARLMAASTGSSEESPLAVAQQLRELLAARDLYPEDPMNGGAGCVAFADARTADYLAEVDLLMAALRERPQVWFTASHKVPQQVQQAAAAARARIPDSESVRYRLPNVASLADAAGESLARLQASYGSVELARALAARGNAAATAAVADYESKSSALQASAADLIWVLSIVDRYPTEAQIAVLLKRLSDALIDQTYASIDRVNLDATGAALDAAQAQVRSLLPEFDTSELLFSLTSASIRQGTSKYWTQHGRTDCPDCSATVQSTLRDATSAFVAELDRRPDRIAASARYIVNDFVSQQVETKRLGVLLPMREAMFGDRQQLVEVLGRRPLDASALPFLGLTLPVDGAPGRAVLAPPPPVSQELAVSLSMKLTFTDGGKTHDLAEVHVDGPQAEQLSQVPGLIAAEVAARILGISNENVWLDRRLNRHLRARLLRRQRSGEHAWAMERYHGFPVRV